MESKGPFDSVVRYVKEEDRPYGVWCLIYGHNGFRLISGKDWNEEYKKMAVGVVIVDKDTSFVISPHNTIVEQWSLSIVGDESIETISDINSVNSVEATDRILEKHRHFKYFEPKLGVMCDYIGSPAANFCRHYSYGGIDEGHWDLPTVKQLRIIAENIKEVNACFVVMGFPVIIKHPYWSSIDFAYDKTCAFTVDMKDGSTTYIDKRSTYYVRAVASFHV